MSHIWDIDASIMTKTTAHRFIAGMPHPHRVIHPRLLPPEEVTARRKDGLWGWSSRWRRAWPAKQAVAMDSREVSHHVEKGCYRRRSAYNRGGRVRLCIHRWSIRRSEAQQRGHLPLPFSLPCPLPFSLPFSLPCSLPADWLQLGC